MGSNAELGTKQHRNLALGYPELQGQSIIEKQEQERRRQTRYKAPRELRVGWQGGGKRDVSRVESLSAGGVFLCTSQPPKPGTLLELIFDVPGGEVRARGMVRHAHPGRGMGVKFVQMEANDRAKLSRFLLSLETQDLNKAEAAPQVWFAPGARGLDSGEIENHHQLFALLHKIYSEKVTGKLQLVLGSIERQLFFDGGQLVFATSSDLQDRLGEMMMRAGALTQQEFEEATALMETGQRFGSAVAEMGVFSVEQVAGWIQRQLTQITSTVLDYSRCRYYFFNELENNVVPEIAIPVSLGKLLLEAVRRAKDLPLDFLAEDEDLFVDISPDPLLRYQAAELDENERKLLGLILRSAPAKELLAKSDLPREGATRALYALMVLGIVASVAPRQAVPKAEEQPAAAAEPAAAESCVAEPVAEASCQTVPVPEPAPQNADESEHKKQFEDEMRALLAACEKATYYELLRVSSNSTTGQVKQSFHRLAQKFHPDRHMGQSEWIGLLQELMSRLTIAYKTLIDEEKRAKYDKQLTSAGAFTLGQEKTESQETVEECLARAKDNLRAHNFAGSILWLRKCVELAPDVPKYHAMLARSLAAVPQYRKEAITRFEYAIGLDPWATSTYFQFGELYELMKLPWRAVPLYKKILEIDPKHSKAIGKLRELEPKKEKSEEKPSFVSRLFQRKS